MAGLGWQELVIVLVIIMIIFGAGKLPKVMGDVAKGVKSFKKGLADDDEAPKPIEAKTTPLATEPAHEEKSKAT